ncbi:unnamed protein product [Urochloa humidicola]
MEDLQRSKGAKDCLNKASRLAEGLDINGTSMSHTGNVAWSVHEASVPVREVFDRLHAVMDVAPTIRDIELALDKMQLAAAADMPQGADLAPMLTPTLDQNEARPSDHGAADARTEAENAPAPSVEDFFTTPAPALHQQPPQHKQRQRQTYDMSKVRRSARLTSKPSMPAVERAQHNLWRKLGLSDDELAPVEVILRVYINMYDGPLPQHIVEAMTTLFELDDDAADLLNDALLQHAGEGVADLQPDADGDAA